MEIVVKGELIEGLSGVGALLIISQVCGNCARRQVLGRVEGASLILWRSHNGKPVCPECKERMQYHTRPLPE